MLLARSSVQLLIGLAFATPLYALTAAMKDESGFAWSSGSG